MVRVRDGAARWIHRRRRPKRGAPRHPNRSNVPVCETRPQERSTAMRRLTLAFAAVAALVPATLGLIGNSSFAQTVPTRVPASAQVVTNDDSSAVPTPVPTRTAEPGDDHGGDRPSGTRTAEPGDDHGGDRPSGTRTAEPG